MSKSKVSRIESGVYRSLSVLDWCRLVDGLGLDLSIRLFRKGVMTETRTGVIEYHTEAKTGAAHCSGPGFTIVWQKGALCVQGDRNGATVEDVIVAARRRLEEFEAGDSACQRNRLAMELLSRACAVLAKGEDYA